MPRPPPSPLIDRRGYEELVQQTVELARRYCPPWNPKPPSSGHGPDLGLTLLQLFCRMARHVVGALNQQPERSLLAFLQLLGAERLPPTAARAPLTFRMVEGSTVEARVPAGTQVAAPATEERQEELLFETERALVLTRARLTSLFVRGGDEQDTYAALSASLDGTGTDAFPAFSGTQPDEHSLFVACEPLFALPGLENLRLQFFPRAIVEGLRGLKLEWSFWDGLDWRQVTGDLDENGNVVLPLKEGQSLAPREVNGLRAHWLRARCTRPPPREKPPVITSLQVTTSSGERKPRAPGQMLFNTTPLEPGNFLPLGPLPGPGDTFYLECGEILAWPGAQVTVSVKLRNVLSPGGSSPVRNPQLAWECWNGSTWERLKLQEDGTQSLLRDGDIKFTLPLNPAPTEVNGQPGYWLRAWLASGDYGNPPEVHAPIIGQLTLGRDAGNAFPLRPPDICFSLNDFTFDTILFTPPRNFTPFRRSADAQPALYLGFDQPFAPLPVSLFFQVDRPRPGEVTREALRKNARFTAPRIVWEYSSKGPESWRRLGVEDDTRAFSQSGPVRFIGPADATARTVFGQERYWLRARKETGDFLVPPRLRRVLTNTTWALHAVTLTGEVLGSSDGSPEQEFFLSHAPVLLGQRIEVLEPPPPPEERATLEREEGPDAVPPPPAGSTDATEVWVRWHPVSDFHASGPTDRHYVLHPLTGAVRFGDGRRGRIPPRGRQNLRAAWYRTGGGVAGNLPAGSITELRTTLPYVESVEHPEAATGGTAAEGLERMRERAPRRIRHRDRAVTAQDFEDIALEASPDVVRVRAITPPVARRPPTPEDEVGRVWLVLVPSGTEPQPTPGLELLRRVEEHVRARCAPAVDVRASGPDWVEVKVTAKLVIASLEDADRLLATARAALDRFLHPLTGGSDGEGWDFGRQPHHSDLYALLSAIPGIRSVKTLVLTSDPVGSHALIFPGNHELTPTLQEGP